MRFRRQLILSRLAGAGAVLCSKFATPDVATPRAPPAARSPAPLVILVRAPSVLIEMGFVFNPADDAALKPRAHRELLARAVDAWFAGSRYRGSI